MPLKVALAQFNASVGDIAGNTGAMRSVMKRARALGAHVLVFPEMSICGYPPEDLLLKKHFLDDNRQAVEQLALDTGPETVIVGFAEPDGDISFNSLAVLQNGAVQRIYRKGRLPNYGVFDEQRYFRPGTEPLVMDIKGTTVALTICEDIWQLDWLGRFFKDTPPKDLLINISASPFHAGKLAERRQLFSRCARHFDCALAYCNFAGGQDELVYDGRSMFLDSTGKVVCQAKAFAEDLLIAEIVPTDGATSVKPAIATSAAEQMQPAEEIYHALVLGTRDYVRKNGFEKVLIGLSGGIDSALTAAVAADALGSENVVGVTMPSMFNTKETISDAEELAKNLAIGFHTIPIAGVLGKFDTVLSQVDGWDSAGVAYENLQARIRGSILMSLSNQFGYMVLTTGNKSETAVGYATLYGDTAGGFAVIKDVLKTMVYRLCRYVNEANSREVIPESTIQRPPSAELREDQKDTDSLPDYDLLDEILKGYIEQDKSAQQLADEGLDAAIVSRIIQMVDRNEYKRRQSPPGVKITPKAFGKDRRMPITNRYKE